MAVVRRSLVQANWSSSVISDEVMDEVMDDVMAWLEEQLAGTMH